MRLPIILLLLLAGCASQPAPVQQPSVYDQLTPEQAWQRGIELRDANQLDEALRHFRSAAERGHREAQFEIGLWYMTGDRALPRDFDQAAPWVEKAAAQGQPDALAYIWQLYFYGKGVGQSDAAAFKWLQRWAGTGNPEAAYRLGLFHYEGIATPVDHQKAAAWFLDAGAEGVPGACYYLGVMHLDGDGVQQSDEDALYWFERGAAEGHPASMLAMGDMNRDGRGRERNPYQARQWYQKAAEQTEDPDVKAAAHERLKQLK